MAEREGQRDLTVGSLLGLPLGKTPPRQDAPHPDPLPRGEGNERVPAQEAEGPGWTVQGGDARRGGGGRHWRDDGVELLDYDNPFGQTMERVWFDGKIVYAVDLGQVDVDADRVKVAQEYQIVYSVDLDAQRKTTRDPEMVERQYNIYDSVPGMAIYSPIWQFNYVVVPRDYVPNTLRSEQDCLRSGYPIYRSDVFEN
jgi:hypothetical protein